MLPDPKSKIQKASHVKEIPRETDYSQIQDGEDSRQRTGPGPSLGRTQKTKISL